MSLFIKQCALSNLCFGAELFHFMSTHKKIFTLVGIATIGIIVTVSHGRVAPPVVQAPTQSTVATTTATLMVAGVAYPITANAGETVIEMMRALSAAGTLTFTGRNYPSLGFFVDSINGRQNADGRYWFLYVNGLSASAGASAVVVNAGDTVEWKYEKEK